MRLHSLLTLLGTQLALLPAQYLQDDVRFWQSLGQEHLNQKLKWMQPSAKPPKNVIFFLGDGMGLSMVTAGRVIAAEEAGRDYRNAKWAFEKFDFSGLLMTSSYDYHTTDSAAGAMALFSGHKVEQNSLGRLPEFGENCSQGEAAYINDGIAELAIAKGLDVGVVSTTRLTDATPAANFAKGVHRLMEFDSSEQIRNTSCIDIAQQMIRHPANKFKVLMGGGHNYFTPTATGGYRTDGRNIETEWLALSANRTLLRSAQELLAHNATPDEFVLGVFHNKSFEYHMDEMSKNGSAQPRLVDMAKKALEVLQKSSNKKGYYLMIEGGHIDLAEHDNQMNLATEELSEFSITIDTIRKMVGDDTLIVVTADHGHALTLPGYTHKNNSIRAAEVDIDGMNLDNNPIPNIHFAAGPGTATNRSSLTQSQWTDPHFMSPAAYRANWGPHGGEDIGVWAQGPYSWLFSGTQENTNMAFLIKFLLCLNHTGPIICSYNLTSSTGGGGAATSTPTTSNDGLSAFSTSTITILAVIAALSSLVALILSILLCREKKANTIMVKSKM